MSGGGIEEGTDEDLASSSMSMSMTESEILGALAGLDRLLGETFSFRLSQNASSKLSTCLILGLFKGEGFLLDKLRTSSKLRDFLILL